MIVSQSDSSAEFQSCPIDEEDFLYFVDAMKGRAAGVCCRGEDIIWDSGVGGKVEKY